MSSNTLRGIGQEGDGGGDGGAKDGGAGQDRSKGAGTPAPEPSGARAEEGRPLLDRVQQLRNIRSLDSTVPGTRSLDSSVPEAQPSLDAKIPTLAATLMGVSAVSLNSREQGTVQGRDVHLPVEVQRVAGVRSISRGDGAIPDPVDHSEPTVADPVRTAVLVQSEGESIHGNAQGRHDLSSHAPWYDQEPVGGDVYDDPKPSILGKVAVGVAVAAGISILLFAAARLRNLDNAAEQAEQAAESVNRPVPAPSQATVRRDIPVPEPTAAAAPSPAPEALVEPAVAPPTAIPSPEPPTAAPSYAAGARLARTPGTAFGPRTSVRGIGQATRPAVGLAPSVAPVVAAVPLTPAGTTATGSPASNAGAVVTTAPATTVRAPAAAAPPSAKPAAETDLSPTAPAPSAPKHAAPREKPKYDPDSTLPLNVD